MKFSKRAQSLVGSATMAATLLAQKKINEGHDIILGTVGEPDSEAPQIAKDSLVSFIQTKESKYGPAQGLLQTRQAIAEWMSNLYHQNWEASQVVISPGSKFTIFSLLQVLCDELDQVLIPAPYWVSYATLAGLAGAQSLIVPCSSSENYKLSAKRLEEYLIKNSKIKVLILNSPNNPTGAVYGKEELEALARVIEANKNLVVICDDIYNQLIYEKGTRTPHLLDVISVTERDRVIVVHGASKSLAMTGWRLGWSITNQKLAEKLTQFQSQTITCVPDFEQVALVMALKNSSEDIECLREKIEQRYKLAVSILSQSKSIRIFPSGGAFYVWFEILNPTASSSEIAKDILEKVGVALLPGSVFGCENHLRLSVTLPESQVEETASRLLKYFQ